MTRHDCQRDAKHKVAQAIFVQPKTEDAV